MSNVTDSIRNAMMLAERGRIGDAISSLRSLLTSHGNDATVHHSLGLLQFQTGAMDQALFHFDKARRLDADRADMLSDYATALNLTGKTEEAAEAFHKAVALDAKSFPAQLGLSSALIGLQDFDGAVESARAACGLSPNRPEPWVNLCLALGRSGRGGEAVKVLRESLAIMPDQPMLLGNLCAALNHRPDVEPTEVFEQHARLGRALTSAYGGAIRSFSNDASPDRMLRIGYLSGEFRDGAMAGLVAPLLGAHTRDRCRPYCYSTAPVPDDTTQRLKSLVWDWKDVSRLPDGAIVQQIIADRIDILVELGGHTPGSRMGVLAQRAAPVQVTWLGYPATTGLRSIGYRIVDAITDPEGAEALSTEKLVRLDGCFLCFSPAAGAPDVAPSDAGGAVTFGSFNEVPKIVEPVVETWAAILRGLSGSRLVLRAPALADDATARRLKEQFAGFGIAADRIDCRPPAPSTVEQLAAYAGIDVALDTFPCNGVATTCEALDMGVPVVTLAGKSHAERVGASVLRCIGRDELIAESTGDYIRIATELAADRARMASMRTGLRAQVRNSPLCDGPGFARKLEGAYRDMWRAWCANLMYS